MPRLRPFPWAVLGVVALGIFTAYLVVLALRAPEPSPPSVDLDDLSSLPAALRDVIAVG